MSPDKTPCAGPDTRGVGRAWSEDPLTARARSVWTSGDFLPIARSFAPSAEEFIARLRLRPGEPVLDVACGTGNLAMANWTLDGFVGQMLWAHATLMPLHLRQRPQDTEWYTRIPNTAGTAASSGAALSGPRASRLQPFQHVLKRLLDEGLGHRLMLHEHPEEQWPE
jgi:hypothetical protein